MKLFLRCLVLGVVVLASRSAMSNEKTAATVESGLYESTIPAAPEFRIDRLVFSKLSASGIEPRLCSDSVFVRRAFLDVIGTLPTADEARQFIDDPDHENKRTVLIEHLLAREEFADYWAMKWGDVLRIKAEFPVNLWPNAAQAYHRWVRSSIVENKPYDQFARELLTSSGSNFRVAPVNFYRAIQDKTQEGIANVVALTLMGMRTDSWPESRRAGFALFFSQVSYKPTAEWKEEVVFWDPLKVVAQASNVAPGSAVPGTAASSAVDEDSNAEAAAAAEIPVAHTGTKTSVTALFPDGTAVTLDPNEDPRVVFANWLITAENPWFARSVVNRVWAWVMGRGIIHEPDDIRDDNPPSHPELLAYLETEFVNSGYNLKHLYRLILTSRVYQLSSIVQADPANADAHFSAYPLRRLDAEVLIDAINSITGTYDLYTSAIPEPFTYIPRDVPAIALADGSITSPFLALFGRSARATGMASERDNKPVSAQWLHLLNSSHIQKKLEGSDRLKTLYGVRRKPEQTLEELYLTVLSRRPSSDEVKRALQSGSADGLTRNDWIDLTWALVNNTEFLYRH
ncbi:MAG TPA: DUF1553 domain-containing protein [Planctomycetaceae bacterium]|nr:DUF1553 domain-containing protein [Planctomycetaceae bacterium]